MKGFGSKKTTIFHILLCIVLSSLITGSTTGKAQEWNSLESEKFIINYLEYESDAEWFLEQFEITATIVQNVYPRARVEVRLLR